MRVLFAGLLGLIAVFGGFAVGFGTFAYGVWLIILMIKGTTAATFGSVLWAVVCCLGAGLVGWAWGLFWGLIATMVGGSAVERRIRW